MGARSFSKLEILLTKSLNQQVPGTTVFSQTDHTKKTNQLIFCSAQEQEHSDFVFEKATNGSVAGLTSTVKIDKRFPITSAFNDNIFVD